jgi:hypothetical protein
MSEPRYVDAAALGYERARWRPMPGAGLCFDEPYRLAQLPLVAPAHPRVIRSSPARPYDMGWCAEARYSLVVPIAADALAASPAFQRLEQELRALPLASKIAWSMLARRAAHLHVTLAGGLERAALDRHSEAVRRVVSELGALRLRVGEPFIGEKNFGRIYFATYPERRADDVFARIQDAVGARRSGLYLLGYYNLLDELDASEAQALFELLERWRDATMAELTVAELLLIATHDDLALSSMVVARC